jgi:hypothetical protein
MFHHMSDVFDWLIEKTGDKSFYVRLFKGNIRNKKEVAPIFRECACLMTSYPDTTRALLQGHYGGWRGAGVGNMIVILQQTYIFEVEQVLSIMGGPLAAPQLAAGFALTTQGQSIPLLEAFLEMGIEEKYQQYPTGILSAYAALKLLGSEKANEFERTSTFADLQAADPHNCVGMTYAYYNLDVWRSDSSTV